jgi:hypothetical protein
MTGFWAGSAAGAAAAAGGLSVPAPRGLKALTLFLSSYWPFLSFSMQGVRPVFLAEQEQAQHGGRRIEHRLAGAHLESFDPAVVDLLHQLDQALPGRGQGRLGHDFCKQFRGS